MFFPCLALPNGRLIARHNSDVVFSLFLGCLTKTRRKQTCQLNCPSSPKRPFILILTR